MNHRGIKSRYYFTQCYSRLAAILLLLLTMGGNAADETDIQSGPLRFEVTSSDSVEQGERLAAVLGCIGCHLPALTGDDWSDPELGILWTANLTHSVTDYTAEELSTMITAGKRPDRALLDMPSYLFSKLHPDDLTALIRYLKSLPVKGVKHPEPTIGPRLAENIASGEFKDSAQRVAEMRNQAPPDLGPEHAFARTILRATCAECHGMDLEGDVEPMMDAPPRPSLRIVAAYSAEAFATLMKTGQALGGRELELMGGVARRRYASFTDAEVKAVYEYLQELAKRK